MKYLNAFNRIEYLGEAIIFYIPVPGNYWIELQIVSDFFCSRSIKNVEVKPSHDV